jgi:predicted amidohydrolase YtcJ
VTANPPPHRAGAPAVNADPAHRRGAAAQPPDSLVLVQNAEVNGHPGRDIRVGSGEILAVGSGLARRRGELVLDAGGGAVIPGLHDHHLHLRAVAAARQSLDLSGAAGPAAFDALVAAAARATAPGRWLRATGWSEHAAGPLDRYRLDALAGPRPVRVQHRSGAMWVLNSAALQQVGAADAELDGVERDDAGRPTGRLLRLDDWLRSRLPPEPGAGGRRADLGAYALECARAGVTGFTDATPGISQAEADELAQLSAAGVIPQRLMLMAPAGLRPPPAAAVTLGPQKLILDDATLPGPAELAAVISRAHRGGSAVAVHCVTAEQLIVTVAALEQAGPADDRIEHASVVPPGYPAALARLGLTVVTQPGFISDRGDDYRREVNAAEQPWLYPCATLLRAGVAVAASTDAPFGPADPWRCIAAAVHRRTPAGHVLGRPERISAARALRLFLGAPDAPARPRTVAPGQPPDLCVLRTPLRDALAAPSADAVRATIIGGQVFHATP